MPFDPSIFEAEVALKLIPTEQLPTKAQQALEAGFDGPRTVRMAILDSKSYWEIEQVLPEMLNELGMTSLSPKEAAMRLATLHAKHLLETREDPISSLSRFHRLMQAGDYPDELQELGWLGDELDGCTGCYTADEQSEFAIEALENLLSPELRERRRAEREAKWLKQREEAKCDWPYIFDSPTRRALLKGAQQGSPCRDAPIILDRGSSLALTRVGFRVLENGSSWISSYKAAANGSVILE